MEQCGPVETAQVGSEMVICVWTVRGNFRKQWAKSTLMTKMVSFILLLSLGELEPLEVEEMKCQPSKKAVFEAKESPLINLSPSLSLSQIASLQHFSLKLHGTQS